MTWMQRTDMKKRTVTTIEIAEQVVISTRTDIPQLPCPVCPESVMVTPEAATVLAPVTVRSIYARVEAEGIHFMESPEGQLLLCANSLSQRERLGEMTKLICATNPMAETPTDKE